MIARLLSLLFPPRLPGHIRDWKSRAEYDEQGSVGPVRRKQYRDGIERYFAERAQPRYFAINSQYMEQMRNAENQMQQHARDLIDAGYINIIHDEWVKE